MIALAAALIGPPAGAHDAHDVGDVEMVVGFGTEPAYTGQPNSVQLILAHHGEPVTNLGDALEVEVSFGDETATLLLEPFFEVGEFGTAGDYRAWFVPSQPGEYTFRFTGRFEGKRIDESFTSGPGSFSNVQDIAGAAFPPTDSPSNEDLAQRIQTESARTAESMQKALRAASAADDAASSARTIGVIGVIVGAIGTIAAIGALATARKR
jgi:hypothetical protein